MVHDLSQENIKNHFVFVVCGERKHIQTLNYSLRHLKRFSKIPAIVVTELARNDGIIEHDNIINESTPPDFDHHQASIYLKTQLHKILDMNDGYCYLDSDVVAVDNQVDQIFEHFSRPVTFSTDHCPVIEFSSNAVNCGCRKKAELQREEFEKLGQEYMALEKKHVAKYVPSDPDVLRKYRELQTILSAFEKKYAWFLKTPAPLQFILSHALPKTFNFEKFLDAKGGFVWDAKKRQIFDQDNNLLYDDAERYPNLYHYIESRSDFRWDAVNQIWLNKEGYYLYSDKCSHLSQAIKNKFDIEVDDHWPHWNGGVFLFDRSSIDFMDTWHQFTMQIFSDETWKTRDQGTLIATAWKLGMQNQKKLPIEFNFLADYGNTNLTFNKDKGFSHNGSKTFTQPHFLHVYHHFGDKNWEVWKSIEDQLTANK